MDPLPITFFFDFTCPFSYVSDEELRRRAARGGVELRARSLELVPHPAPLVAPAEAREWEETVAPLAATLGLPLSAPGFRPRTAKAHEALRFAREHGVEEGMRGRIFAAYWGEGRDVGRIDVLAGLADEVGLDAGEARIALDIDLHRDAVLEDRALALRLRVASTPTTFVGTGPGARILVGVLTPDGLDAALRSR